MSKRDINTGKKYGDNFCYYYLHINGQMICKDKMYNTSSFDESPFVKVWWIVDLENRMDGYLMLLSAAMHGANKEAIDALIYLYKITDEDCMEFCKRMKLSFRKEEGLFYVNPFVLMPENKNEGSGQTLFDAIIDLTKKEVAV